MTIDEAIQHCEEKARWLRELKFRRKAQADLDAVRWRADEEARAKGCHIDK